MKRIVMYAENVASLQDIIKVMNTTNQAVFPVSGDCMEGLNIVDGGFVGVDFSHFPRPYRKEDPQRDACLCYGTFPGQSKPSVMVKQYCGVWGPYQNVGTNYKHQEGKPFRFNCGFNVDAVFGVVFVSFDPDGKVLWSTDPDTYPKQLWTSPTIHGENISDPMEVQTL